MRSLQRASHRARTIHQTLGIRSHSDLGHLVEICVARGAFVREEKMDGASARLVVQNRRGIISVAPTRNPGRRRFSIAHELGHFEMHREGQSFWSCTDQDLTRFSVEEDRDEKESSDVMDPELEALDAQEAQTPIDPQMRRLLQEKEANAFAAELLMPERLLKPLLPRGQLKLHVIQELAQQFEVSWLAMAYRIFEVLPEPCLLIVQPNGTLPTVLRAPAFRRAGRLEILERTDATSGSLLSDWVSFRSEGASQSLVRVDTEIKQTGTRVDLIWAPEFNPVLNA